jgi:2-polyprenyl-3-methyl-5-hydroxy-6-metoxy-1,4-benzoquinol methylase
MEELELLTRFKKDSEWLFSKLEEFREKFKNEFVVVENQEVIEHDKNLEKVMESLRNKGKNPSLILIRFIPEKGTVILY